MSLPFQGNSIKSKSTDAAMSKATHSNRPRQSRQTQSQQSQSQQHWRSRAQTLFIFSRLGPQRWRPGGRRVSCSASCAWRNPSCATPGPRDAASTPQRPRPAPSRPGCGPAAACPGAHVERRLGSQPKRCKQGDVRCPRNQQSRLAHNSFASRVRIFSLSCAGKQGDIRPRPLEANALQRRHNKRGLHQGPP